MGMDGPITVRVVTDADATAARALVAACNRHEGLDLAVNLDRSAVGEPANQFVCHEDHTLVGIATLEPQQEIEACVAVHPGHRRRGIGRRLLDAIKTQTRERGRRSCLLVCEEASASGRGFVTTAGARYRNAEHRMRLHTAHTGVSSIPRTALRLEHAQPVHLEAIGRILAASFGSDPVHEQQRVVGDLRKPTHRYFVATLGGEPVGTFGVVIAEGRVYIIGFGILPAFRGRGHGRTMLRDAIELLTRERWREIYLEVATENEPAVALYRSAGFGVTSTYGFYELAV
jgi:ribosomal protein S18 acetylase RimI-like enzyme